MMSEPAGKLVLDFTALVPWYHKYGSGSSKQVQRWDDISMGERYRFYVGKPWSAIYS